jgi:crotonobetainyl-CoA:carnitine CoA-transferase CaiB-like acyl-CoA transferase
MGPLEGIRVLDLTQAQQGPVASLVLGELGAEVIKIEGLEGEMGRGVVKFGRQSTEKQGRNYYFEGFNLNKKGITLDLKKPKGKEIFFQLIEKADVFITNVRQQAITGLGIDYATVYQYNPKIIYAVASGWGPKGPEKDEPAFDHSVQAATGMHYIWGVAGDQEPLYWNIGIADQIGGLVTAHAVVVALFHRERTGVGQEVKTSLYGSMIFSQSFLINFLLTLGTTHAGAHLSRFNQPNVLINIYKCRDGKWIRLVCPQFERYWPGVCDALDIEKEIENDPRWQGMDARESHASELTSILDSQFSQKPAHEYLEKLRKNGVICSLVKEHLDLPSDPQALANDYITGFDHPVWGQSKFVGLPINFSETPCAITREAPELGQHTEEVLTELLGYTRDEIFELKDQKVI